MGDPPYKLLLIDEDPIFRLGLRTMLGQFSDLMVVAEADSSPIALQILDASGITKANQLDQRSTQPHKTIAPSVAGREGLVILDLELSQHGVDSLSSLELCSLLKQRYPNLGVLVIGNSVDSVRLRAMQRAGADGYCSKRVEIAEMVMAIRQVVAGHQYDWDSPERLEPNRTQGLSPRRSPRGFPTILVSTVQQAHQNLRSAGLGQIDAAIGQVSLDLEQGNLSWFDRAVWAGRRRELRAARRLVTFLLPEIQVPSTSTRMNEPPSVTANQSSSQDSQTIPLTPQGSRAQLTSLADQPIEETGIIPPPKPATNLSIVAVLLDAAVAQLQSNLLNLTNSPLEIDILKLDKKRQLLYLVLRKFEDMLAELKFSKIQPDQLTGKRAMLIRDLWEAVTSEFFGRYYSLTIYGRSQEVVPTLLLDLEVVETAILQKIPLVEELLAHLLFQTPLWADQETHAVGSPEAMQRSQALLQNLMIQVANAVIQPLLNHFAHAEALKQTFYDRRLLSTREIERFRNDLSWRYRLVQYVSEPAAIFESRFQLFVLGERGIQQTTIYSPRNQELENLQGISSLVPLALELRDAVSPRLRSAISLLGSGLVYILTEVIGRGLGLVGRGVLKGIGHAFQDGKFKEGGKEKQ